MLNFEYSLLCQTLLDLEETMAELEASIKMGDKEFRSTWKTLRDLYFSLDAAWFSVVGPREWLLRHVFLHKPNRGTLWGMC